LRTLHPDAHNALNLDASKTEPIGNRGLINQPAMSRTNVHAEKMESRGVVGETSTF
jgi:hypothetical protein